MAGKELIEKSQIETNRLIKEIDDLVEKYLTSSPLPQAQRLVNVGRALNAYHVCWVQNLAKTLEEGQTRLIKNRS